MGAEVTVVIPCLNAESVVEEAVRSALEQTIVPAEIICIDDGSTDSTPQILERLAIEHRGRVSVLRQPRSGACAARNKGLYRASTEYIQFLDADDLLLPRKLEHQLAFSSGNNKVDVVAGSFVRHRLDGSRNAFVMWPMDPWAALPQVRLGITSANLFRKEAVERAGGWDEDSKSSQEYELMFRMLQDGCSVAFDVEPLTIIRQQARSITASNRQANVLRRIELGIAIRNHVRAHVQSTDALQAADAGLFHVIRMLTPHDMESGVETFYQFFADKDDAPVRAKSSPMYTTLYRLLGYRKTEQIRSVARRLNRKFQVDD